MSYYVYIILSASTGRFYTGQTKDLHARIERHNSGKNPYTSKGLPWELVHCKIFETRQEAMERERSIKARKSAYYIKRLIGSTGRAQEVVPLD